MSIPTLNRAQMKEVDRRAVEEYGIQGLVLMENAGRGAADRLLQLGTPGRVVPGRIVICCGKGNNAGDGFVVARHLELRGQRVEVLLWADPESLPSDAATNFNILRKTDVPIHVMPEKFDAAELEQRLTGAAWIVDALLGTGSNGEPRPPLDKVIDAINEHPAQKLAIDIPSGLDCDTGKPSHHTIRADETCTFVAAKPGFFSSGAERYTGRLHVAVIGAPKKLVDRVRAESA